LGKIGGNSMVSSNSSSFESLRFQGVFRLSSTGAGLWITGWGLAGLGAAG
jgi:hypothetical protein